MKKNILYFFTVIILLWLTSTTYAWDMNSITQSMNRAELHLTNYNTETQLLFVKTLMQRIEEIEHKNNKDKITYLTSLLRIKEQVLLNNKTEKLDYKWFYYFTTNNIAYIGWVDGKYEELQYVDAKTFTTYDHTSWYFFDKNYLYSINSWYGLVKIDKKYTPFSWNFLSYDWEMYYNFVWLSQNKIPWLDLDTFQVGKWYLIYDKNWVYFFHIQYSWTDKIILDDIDSQSFESISDNYFKDKNWVYKISWLNWGYENLDVDITTFKEFQDGYMYDKNCIYVGTTCVKKEVDTDINIIVKAENPSALWINASSFEVFVELNSKKQAIRLNYGAGNYNTWGARVKNNETKKILSNLETFTINGVDLTWNLLYERPGVYRIVVFVTYKDGTIWYNTKKITVHE